MAVDGAPLWIDGAVVREGTPYPRSFGIPSGDGKDIERCGIADPGSDYAGERTRLVEDGQPMACSGDVLDIRTLR